MTKILMFTTNIKNTDSMKDIGVTLEEFAIPYLIFKATGYEVEIVSLLGSISPVDETSMSCSNPMEWDDCIKILRETKKIDEINPDDFDAIYFVGGHGAMFDFSNNEKIKNLINEMNKNNKIISAICHGVAAFVGLEIIKDKYITSFTSKEEKILKTDEFMPFCLQEKLVETGAKFVETKPWNEHVEVDKNIITAQNNKSSTLIAEKIIDALENKY